MTVCWPVRGRLSGSPSQLTKGRTYWSIPGMPCRTTGGVDHSLDNGRDNASRLTGADETFGFATARPAGAGGSAGLLAAGTDLGGVTIIRLLGSGGMGQVYEAQQHAPPRRVAVKVVATPAGSQLHPRLEDEAALLGQLNHPQIARVYTVGRWNAAGRERPWIMMELVDGGLPITDWVCEHDLPLAGRVALVQDAANGLAAAHARGVIHLDLKPSNILVDRHGVLKLIDFGIGRRLAASLPEVPSPAGPIIGTPAAMSPEQLAGRDDLIDARSDIYSLGLVFSELVDGQPSPVGASRFAAADLTAILDRCLAVDPADRFATAHEFAAELTRWQTGQTLCCRSPGWSERLVRWAGRHPAVAGLTSIVVATMLVAVVTIAGFALENARQRSRAVQAADSARISLASALLRQAVAAGEQHDAETVTRMLDERAATLAAVGSPPPPGLLPANDGLAISCLRAGLDEAVAAWSNPEGPVTAVAVAAAGNRAVAGDAAGRLTVFSLVEEGLAVQTELNTGVGRIWSAVISPAGDQAAVAGDSGTIELIDLDRAAVVGSLGETSGRVYGLAFLPIGNRLVAAGRDGIVRLWDLKRQTVVRRLASVGTSVYGVAVSPDGETLAAAVRDGTAWLWNIATGKPTGQLAGHKGRVFSVAFSPDGSLLATASEDQTVRLWEADSLRERRRFDHPARVNAVRFCGPDRLLTAAGDRLLRCWQVAGQRPPRELAGHTAGLWAVAETGGVILTGSDDGTLRQWKGAGDPQPRLATAAAVKSLAVSPDGRHLAAGTVAGGLVVWDAATGRQLAAAQPASGAINCLCWLPDSESFLVASEGRVSRYRIMPGGAGSVCELVPESPLRGHRRRVFAVAATADGRRFATAGEDKTVRLWSPAGEQIAEHDHPGRVFTVAFAVDGRLASGCEDGLLRIFAADGRDQFQAQGHQGQVNSLCWNRQPERGWDIATAGSDGLVQLWRLPPVRTRPDGPPPRPPATAEPVMSLRGATGKIWQIAACQREPLLAAATDAGEIILWNTTEPSPLEVLTGHGDAAWAVALGPGERWLASGGWDRTVRFWGRTARDWAGRLAE